MAVFPLLLSPYCPYTYVYERLCMYTCMPTITSHQIQIVGCLFPTHNNTHTHTTKWNFGVAYETWNWMPMTAPNVWITNMYKATLPYIYNKYVCVWTVVTLIWGRNRNTTILEFDLITALGSWCLIVNFTGNNGIWFICSVCLCVCVSVW